MTSLRARRATAQWRSLGVRARTRARWWRPRTKPARCAMCGLIVMPDDAIGLLPGARPAHAECALVHMLGSSQPHGADDQGAGRNRRTAQRSGLTDEQWETLLRVLSAPDSSA